MDWNKKKYFQTTVLFCVCMFVCLYVCTRALVCVRACVRASFSRASGERVPAWVRGRERGREGNRCGGLSLPVESWDEREDGGRGREAADREGATGSPGDHWRYPGNRSEVEARHGFVSLATYVNKLSRLLPTVAWERPLRPHTAEGNLGRGWKD